VATDGVDALLCPPGDVEALAGALRRALTDGRLRATLHLAAEARAQEFSMDRLAEAYVERYERLVAEHPQPPDRRARRSMRRRARHDAIG
jgi:glycosyltransferase involved in cell wall biosynthesis